MILIWLSTIAAALAALPTLLFLRNLSCFRPLPAVPAPALRPRISLLIPARNEERNIGAAIRSALRSRGVELEVIVFDDGSVDRTREIVEELRRRDPRVRLLRSDVLPTGWRGKTFACDQLARSAEHLLLVFMDADVRIARSDTLRRLALALQRGEAAMLSGLPRQRTGTLLEKLIVPLIHWVLLGFLPIRVMRRTTKTEFAAGCGQVIAVRRHAYEDVGAHRVIRGSLHDGIALARAFRAGGHKTDIFDGTDSFTCRMYHCNADVWSGFTKNSAEGLGRPPLLLPATLLLLGGQVLPFLLLLGERNHFAFAIAALGSAVSLWPRILSVWRFKQDILGAALHPVGVLLLVCIQWHGFLARLFNRPPHWRGRPCAVAPVA